MEVRTGLFEGGFSLESFPHPLKAAALPIEPGTPLPTLDFILMQATWRMQCP
jgi:hypothetical protein